MTTTLIETPAPDPIADAIAALTAAARRERTIGAGTPNEHIEPVDFGEIACHVITAVAANVGGVEVLLSGRPGSWEADYVRQIVQSTAGDDDTELLRYRTEPVRIEFDAEDRLFDPAKGGGAVLDLGVYVVNFAQAFLGDVKAIDCMTRLYGTGVEKAASINLTHSAGGLSSLTCGFDGPGPGRMSIIGTKGWIEVEPRFHHPTKISIHRAGVLPRIIEARPMGRGYSHEIAEVTACIDEGLTESTTMPTVRCAMFRMITTVKLLISASPLAFKQLNLMRRSTIGTMVPRRLITPLMKAGALAIEVTAS